MMMIMTMIIFANYDMIAHLIIMIMTIISFDQPDHDDDDEDDLCKMPGK